MAQLRAFLTTVGGAVAYVGFCSLVGRLRILPAKLSRKLMHIGESLGCSRLASRSWAHMPKDIISALRQGAAVLRAQLHSCSLFDGRTCRHRPALHAVLATLHRQPRLALALCLGAAAGIRTLCAGGQRCGARPEPGGLRHGERRTQAWLQAAPPIPA